MPQLSQWTGMTEHKDTSYQGQEATPWLWGSCTGGAGSLLPVYAHFLHIRPWRWLVLLWDPVARLIFLRGVFTSSVTERPGALTPAQTVRIRAGAVNERLSAPGFPADHVWPSWGDWQDLFTGGETRRKGDGKRGNLRERGR